MKAFSSALIFVVLLHLQCGGSCIVEAFGREVHATTTETHPPCHQDRDGPADNQHPSHDVTSPCTQGQLIESKTYNAGKVLLEVDGVLPAIFTINATSDSGFRAVIQEKPSLVLPAAVPISILRI